MKQKNNKIFMEPFRIKMVEPLRFSTRQERQKALQKAGLNVFLLPARDVMIDLLTDSGTGAMSAEQWSALQRGDESYAGAESFFRFEKTIQKLTGMELIIPVHQGRGAERILLDTFRQKGEYVVSNTLFDTTRANAQLFGFKIKDLPCEEGEDILKSAPFKGNIDLNKLEFFLKSHSVALVIMTLTNNSAGGQPVSMENLNMVSTLCKKNQVPLVLDACRFAENAYFIKQREEGFKNKSLVHITKALFGTADMAYVSAKKDGLSHSGGFLALRDKTLSQEFKNRLIPAEGFPTYGGMTGRDMETVAVGLKEVLDESYLYYRVSSVKKLHDQLKAGGVPVVSPPGGHAVFVDAKNMLSHIPPSAYPGQALVSAFYVSSGVRAVEIGSVMFGGWRKGQAFCHSQELVRLAVPRRTYTKSHLNYVAEQLIEFSKKSAPQLKGLKFVFEPPVLRHFTARFAWIT